MNDLQINISIDPSFYCKDPESSALGKKIMQVGIEMIHELGYEAFTFKKLGVQINSNESSIYRYFESKHSFLVYLVNWYWSWIECKLVFATINIHSAEERLEKSIQILTEEIKEDNEITFINEVLLNKIIISESSKAYHTIDVDKENEKGYYKTYKRVVQRVCDFVLEVNPKFEYPHMLISTIIEGAHHQKYFSKHLPSLTDVEEGKNSIVEFFLKLTKSVLR
ncbi:TetR/AcrR family transcriptional regulator [Flavobacteriaceae bacterium]|jgi:AcrR family transcriptional regulator|nr:TetR/AcrR family transcriptional regulator [Flavobacteriaceae bacterium]MDB2327854.1 TetR/AcrR family transcriptional regulator [Flavobacteriaceae bacterium]